MCEYLHRLFAHTRWADKQTLAALQAAASTPVAELEIYAHILGAEELWLSRIQERSSRVAVWPSLTLAECAGLSGQTHAAYAELLASLTDADLRRPIHYRNSAGAVFDSLLEDILLHVALHGSYHRGQVARGLRQSGIEPAPTDYIAFIRGAPAATRQT